MQCLDLSSWLVLVRQSWKEMEKKNQNQEVMGSIDEQNLQFTNAGRKL